MPRLVRIVDPGHHNAVGTQIKHAVNPLSLVRLDSNHHGGVCVFKRLQLVKHITFRTRAVFEIDEYPIESGSANNFCSQRRAKAQ
jgi:hypothetical protein